MRNSTILSILLMLVAAGSAAAQDSTDAAPYFLLIDSVIETQDAGDWAAAVAATAKAHARHPKGNNFMTYRQLTGGPEESVKVLFPLDRMGDLDEWISNRQVLFEVMGEDRGQVVLDDLELERDSSERILSYSEKLSRPPRTSRAPKHIWLVEVEVEAGAMAEYSALATRVKRAHEQSDRGMTWLVYGNAVGGNRSQLIYLYGFDDFAALDDWPSRKETLSAAYGEEKAARLAAAIESLAKATSSLWSLEPELSQLKTK